MTARCLPGTSLSVKGGQRRARGLRSVGWVSAGRCRGFRSRGCRRDPVGELDDRDRVAGQVDDEEFGCVADQVTGDGQQVAVVLGGASLGRHEHRSPGSTPGPTGMSCRAPVTESYLTSAYSSSPEPGRGTA